MELRGLGDLGLALAVNLAVALAAILVVTLVRLAVAAMLPLAPDETYYWIWSHALAGGYLDHPPMVALWIRAGTSLVGQTALGVRLLGPLAAALASWMLFDTARALFPGTKGSIGNQCVSMPIKLPAKEKAWGSFETASRRDYGRTSPKAGFQAVLLLNASLFLGVGTIIMTPDSPLLFFWTATFWAMARLAAGGPGLWWLAAGTAGGLALDSKYTALFLWVGVGLWVLLVPAIRPWLRRWQPWAACAIGLVLFAPVLSWNAAHDWAGLIRQGGRVDDWRPARAIGFLAELLGGQIGLATPLVWALCMAGLVVAARRTWRHRDPCWSLLLALSLPPIVVFLQHAIGDRVQGNWPAIIYPALTVAAGGMVLRPRWWVGASALGFAITAVVYAQAATGLIPLSPRLNPIAMRLAGWDGLAAQVEASRTATGAVFVVADSYAVTSELAWWLPPDTRVIGTEPRWRLLNLPSASIKGMTGLLVAASSRGEGPDGRVWTRIERVRTADRPGSGSGSLVLYKVVAGPDAEAIAVARR